MKTLISTFAVLTLIVNISFAQSDKSDLRLNTENLFKAPFISAVPVGMLAPTEDYQNTQQSMQSITQNSEKDIVFIENLGQIRDSKGNKRPDVLFLTRSQGIDMYITSSGITYVFRKTEGDVRESAAIRKDKVEKPKTNLYRLDMEFVGINKNINIEKELATGQQFNYYTPEYPNGISPKGFKKITIENIYEGIDLVYYEKEGKMKYDFIVKAGANPNKIKMKYKGASTLYLDKDGSVIVTTPMGEIREEKPYSYSINTGKKIESRYRITNNFVQFDIANYDSREDITIDPYRIWATYYGGSGHDRSYSICTDNSENIYVTGWTESTDFPTQILSGAYNQSTSSNIADAYIIKFNSAGTRLWSTYYGGSDIDYGEDICTDNTGNLYVTGETVSIDFPTQTLSGAYNQPANGGSYDIFILKFNSSGARLWATFYGGISYDYGWNICTDNSGNLYVTGGTVSTNFPTQNLTGAYNQGTLGGFGWWDAVIMKFDNNCARLWATYYGGSTSDYAWSVCTDNNDNIYVTGATNSSNFPTLALPGAYNQTTLGGVTHDAFILKFSSSSTRLWATYYGGIEYDVGRGICTDNLGALYITGYTGSTNFPTQTLTGAYNQPVSGGDNDAFLLKFNNSGARLWATYYGGNNEDIGHRICTNNSDNLYVTGWTASTDFPTQTLSGTYNQSTIGGGDYDAFILSFNNQDSREWATYYGGGGSDEGHGICTDSSGSLYVTGLTSGTNFPMQVFAGAYNQTTYGGGDYDSFILKFSSSPVQIFEILNDDGLADEGIHVNDGVIVLSKLNLNEKRELFQLLAVKVFIYENLNEPLNIVCYDESEDLPGNQVFNLIVEPEDLVTGWNEIELTQFVTFSEGSLYLGVAGPLENSTIGLDTDTQGETLIYTNSNWETLQSGNIMVRAIMCDITNVNDKVKLTDHTLSQNYPNPFNSKTAVSYKLQATSFVILKIFDVSGKEITTLVNEKQPPGNYEVEFDGTRLQAGVYYYRLTVDKYAQTKKMILIK